MGHSWKLRDLLFISAAFIVMAVSFSVAAVVGLTRGWPLLIFGPALGYFLWRRVPPVTWMATIQHEFEQAAWFGDDANAITLAEELMTELRRWTHAPWMADLLEAGCLAFQERYEQAVGILSRLNTAAMNEASETLTLNSVAWCKAHLGQAQEAVDIARGALRRAEASAEPAVVALCRGTLGTALVFAGQAQEAIEPLEAAIKSNRDRPAQLACHSYYLAMANWELGKIPETLAALQRAITVAPETRFGTLAVNTIRQMQKGGEEEESADTPAKVAAE